MRIIAVAMPLALVLLAGCASNSGVFQVGTNTYQISTRATWELGGRAGAKETALKEATRYCVGQQKTLHVLNISESYNHFEGGTVDLVFSCDGGPPPTSSDPFKAPTSSDPFSAPK